MATAPEIPLKEDIVSIEIDESQVRMHIIEQELKIIAVTDLHSLKRSNRDLEDTEYMDLINLKTEYFKLLLTLLDESLK